jgi:hypothetical protein
VKRVKKLTIPDPQSKIKSHVIYRRPKFLTVLHKIRETMSREADYDVDLFAEMVRSGKRPEYGPERNIRGFKKRAPKNDESENEPSLKEPRHAAR